jgi:AcrR family transcriptional regulator
MPKRDALYMENQREMIARAALECMLEKGLAATSTREICVQAGISKGALYAHFKTREEIVLAAGGVERILPMDPVDNWADYESALRTIVDTIETSDRHRRLWRVSYEFLAELLLADITMPGVDAEWDRGYRFVRMSMEAMHRRGEVTLPLGLEPTVQLHAQMISGVIFSLLGDQRQSFVDARANFLAGAALIAGRKAAVGQGKTRTKPARS